MDCAIFSSHVTYLAHKLHRIHTTSPHRTRPSVHPTSYPGPRLRTGGFGNQSWNLISSVNCDNNFAKEQAAHQVLAVVLSFELRSAAVYQNKVLMVSERFAVLPGKLRSLKVVTK